MAALRRRMLHRLVVLAGSLLIGSTATFQQEVQRVLLDRHRPPTVHPSSPHRRSQDMVLAVVVVQSLPLAALAARALSAVVAAVVVLHSTRSLRAVAATGRLAAS